MLGFYLIQKDVYSHIWNGFIRNSNVYVANAKFFIYTLTCYKVLELPLELIRHFYIEQKFGFNKYTIKLFF